MLTVSDGQDDNAYHAASISLSGYTLTSSFQVRIRSLMVPSDDFFYIDDLQIVL